MAVRPCGHRCCMNLIDDSWNEMLQSFRMLDQDFNNVDILPDECFHCVHCPCRVVHQSQRTNRPRPKQTQTGVSEVVNSDMEFRISIDVQDFEPDELTVKTRDNRLIIKARHEEREDEHGLITREFKRQYVLPKDVDPASVTSSLSREGVLTLKAPKMALGAPKETIISISIAHGTEG